MSSNPWSIAFKRAIEVEEEGAKDFVEILAQHAEKKQRSTIEVSTGMHAHSSGGNSESSRMIERNNADSDSESNAEVDRLSKLSKFVMEASAAAAIDDKTSQSSGIAQSAQVAIAVEPVKERDMVEVCGRQMCRAWLKHHYLKIGNPCKDGDACLRKHVVTCKPELLYKDYSFKGLSPKQRKAILEQIKAESVS